MGLVKAQMMEDEANADMYDWIRENASPDVEEDDEEWNALKQQYLLGSHVDYDDWDNVDYEEEIQWYSKEERAFPLFNEQMNEVRNSLAHSNSPIVLKMKFAYVVTLMESCLGDMLKGIIFSDEDYLSNAIKNVSDLNSTKLPLQEIHETSDIVKKTVLKVLGGILYHKIDKVLDVYKSVLNEDIPKNIKEKAVNIKKIVEVRHDIVHRNGYDRVGGAHDITVDVYIEAVDDVLGFVKLLHQYTQSAKLNYLTARFSEF
ncbi:HEPN domain-containing protein [Serratia plymuthica]|uniref:HEPN domain-containing protein n=1 Tax=Serratia plymuthica TaxID=82996 RepID=UPI000F0080F1|nr:HEPN domain-containing protein [Serratia plymuthica]